MDSRMESRWGGDASTPRPAHASTQPAHPALQALMQSLTARTHALPAAPAASASGSASARSASGHAYGGAHLPVSLRSLPPQQQQAPLAHAQLPRRQSSAAMRRKLRSLEAARLPLSPAHAAAQVDGSAAAAAATPAAAGAAAPVAHGNGALNLPPSLLPAAARVHSRAPLAPFAAGLSRSLGQSLLTGGLPSGAQWEQLVFPSANPLADGSGEGEVRRLGAWFDAAWAQLEQGAQAQAESERQQRVRADDAKARALRIEQLSGGIIPTTNGAAAAAAAVEEEEHKGDGSSVVPASLTPALLRQLDESRSRLVFIVFQELLRHVTALCRRRGALLEKIWAAQSRLNDNRTKHRIAEALSSASDHSASRLAAVSAQFAAAVRAEQAAHIRSGVELTYLSAELEAKERIIGNLQEENDKDLLYSNKTLCQKELAVLRLQRECAQVSAERQRADEQLKFLADDKAQLEGSLAAMEEERDELVAQCALLQEMIDARARAHFSVECQYDSSDVPAETSAIERRQSDAALQIQRLFRGFRTRRRLKMHGLLSRKLILKRLHNLRVAAMGAGAAAAAGAKGKGSAGVVGGGGDRGGGHVLPLIPRAFSHLLNAVDMSLHRAHFVRMFARKNLLKWISSLYDEKAYQDYSRARSGKVRKEFAEFVYDLYLLRHGSRDAAEMDLLDLFASVEKHVATSARVRLFSMLLNNAYRHRKLLLPTTTGGNAEAQPAGGSSASASASASALTHAAAAARPPSPQYHMSEQERSAHDLKCRLVVSLHGGRSLSARVLDFLLRFRAVAKKIGRGPFQSVSDNHDGVMWIHMDSLVDIVTRVMQRLPPFLLAAAVSKMQHKATTDSMKNGTAGPTPNQPVLLMASLSRPSPASSPTSALVSAAASRFVDLDAMLEVIVETYIDEDARMHAALLDVLMHPNPALCVQQQKERSHNRQRSEFADAQMERANAADADGTATAAAAAAGDPAAATPDIGENDGSSSDRGGEGDRLEPEMYSFMHFCTVLRALSVGWDEERLLRVYQQSVQRAVHRPVAMADFVVTARCYGVMSVELEWERVESGARAGDADAGEGAGILGEGEDPASAAAAAAAALDVELPPLDEDAPMLAQGDLLERRLQELKDKMRETEAMAHSKQEHASRRHERELSQVRQSHERELEALQQAHQRKLDAFKRAHDDALVKAAADYNALFESSGAEVRHLKLLVESAQRKQKEHASATTKHFTNKLLEEERTISLLQSKLASKSDKYKRAKAALVAMQHAQRVQHTEAQETGTPRDAEAYDD